MAGPTEHDIHDAAVLDAVKKEFGRWLASKREEVGFATQDDAARAAGVSRISWARYETGATSPGRKTIRGIANALRVDETEVLARVGLSVLPKGNFVQIAKVADVIGNGPVTEATAQQLLREIRNLTYRLDEQNSIK